MEMNDNERIACYAKELKMSAVKDVLDDAVSDAVQNQWDYRHFLCDLLRREVEHRAENRKYQRIRKAGFPQMKYLQELLPEVLPVQLKSCILLPFLFSPLYENKLKITLPAPQDPIYQMHLQ